MNIFGRQSLVLVTAMLGIVAFPVFTASAYDSTSIDQQEYWQLVQDTHAEIQHLEGLSVEERRQPLETLATRWEAVTEVRADGQVYPVNNHYLPGLLRAVPPDLEKIDGILVSLLSAQRDYPQQLFSGAELEALHTILSWHFS